MNRFVFEYIDKHRNKLQNLSPEDFDGYFSREQICKQYRRKRITRSYHQWNKKDICKHLKLLFIEELFDTHTYYKYYLPDDPMIRKVKTLFRKNGS